MTSVVDFTDSIGIAPINVWVQVELTEGDPSVGLKADAEVLAVYALDNEGHLKGCDMAGAFEDGQHARWCAMAVIEANRQRRQAEFDAAAERAEAMDTPYRMAA